jgi:hypothetical protein
MRRSIVIIGAMALTTAACGGASSETTSTEATTTTAAATTTAATTAATTTAATTTTADPAAARVAMAQTFAGEWTGEWNNTTYGSTGPIAMAVAVDAETHLVTLTIDLGGSVFGMGDPGPFDVSLDLSMAPPYSDFVDLFGVTTVDMQATGDFTLEALEVLVPGITSFEATGTATPTAIDLDYTVVFDGGGEAVGTATITR